MNSTSIKIKKFLSNRNTVTIICAILGIIVLYVGYTMKIQSAVQPVTIPYAKVTIQPRTKITEEMIGYMTIAQAAVDEMGNNVIRDTKKLVNYYSNVNTMIPKGSLFYNSSVVEKDKIAGAALFDIDYEKEVLYYHQVNMSTSYVNSILPGGYIDLYVRHTDENKTARVGKFIKNIKVLAVKTSDGLNVFENSDELRVPAYIMFAVTPEEQSWLLSASQLGINIFPVPTSISEEQVKDEEEKQTEAGGAVVRITSQEIIDYLEEKSEHFAQDSDFGEVITPGFENNQQQNGE